MTINLTNNRIKFAVVFLFLFLSCQFVDAKNFIFNEKELVGEKAAQKINEIGQELHNKTKINVYAIIDTTIGNLSIQDYIDVHVKNFEFPYVLLIIISEDKIIDILDSGEDISKRFDKKKILSPFPLFGGTVLPLLADKKKDNDKYSAALLNGYADLTDQIAKSYNVKLESSIGNTNKTTLNFFRFLIYGFIVVVIIVYIQRRMRIKNAKE